jgi:hypothetical protein
MMFRQREEPEPADLWRNTSPDVSRAEGAVSVGPRPSDVSAKTRSTRTTAADVIGSHDGFWGRGGYSLRCQKD